MDSRIIDNIELREQIRTFLTRIVGIEYETIDKINIYRMQDGQLRDIRISFIPKSHSDRKT